MPGFNFLQVWVSSSITFGFVCCGCLKLEFNEGQRKEQDNKHIKHSK